MDYKFYTVDTIDGEHVGTIKAANKGEFESKLTEAILSHVDCDKVELGSTSEFEHMHNYVDRQIEISAKLFGDTNGRECDSFIIRLTWLYE